MHGEPPYLRIVAELRRRIAAGELAPGDRVPSTRQLSRDWDVALATATKALTVLRQQGVVESRPRSGTVVAGPVTAAAPAAAPDGDLSRDRVVRAGIEIADADGIGAMSMRAVAARLGVATMSPYRYVAGRDDLLLLMADSAFGEIGYPADPPPTRRARLELVARTQWALYRRHPWLAELNPLSRPVALPNLLVHGEHVLAALDGLGLDPVARFNLNVLLYNYVQGIAVNLAGEARARATTGLSDEDHLRNQGPALDAVVNSGRFPQMAGMMAVFAVQGFDLDLDALFELGLGLLLDGLAPTLSRTAP